jgi:hypothetical protein
MAEMTDLQLAGKKAVKKVEKMVLQRAVRKLS